MRSSAIVLALLAAWAGIVRGQDPLESMRKTREFQDAYQKGRAEADRELKDQCATILVAGFSPSPGLDRGTGLPYRQLGCGIDDQILGRIDGHNDRIREFIKDHGLPKCSFKAWEKELFGLKVYIESRRKLVQPETLTVDGPAWRSPDGSCTLRIVTNEIGTDGTVMKGPWLEIRAEGRPPGDIILYLAGVQDTFEVFPGPEGSGFAVLACKGSQSGFFEAVDLKRGRGLRMELDPPPGLPADDKPGDRPGPR